MRTRALLFSLAVLLLLLQTACGSAPAASGSGTVKPDVSSSVSASGPAQPVSSLELTRAEGFSVDFYEGDATRITIHGDEQYLLLPEGTAVPAGLEDLPVIHSPVEHIYLAASSAMDFFRQLNALPQVRLTSTTANNWSIPEVLQALEDETLLYAGKYSAPDYELLLAENTDLAIESTMIFHSPKIQEQLEGLGIPVMVERSSYEPDPLGRLEWIKLYGVLTGHLREAEDFFNAQMDALEPILAETENGSETGPTVAFFAINSNGSVVVRKPGDYISRLIAMAGGQYVFSDLEGSDDNDLSTLNMQMESFYAGARDADILIYNSTIEAELSSMDDLLKKSELLSGFRAVETGQVWCTGKDMYQQTTGLGDLLLDFHRVISGEDEAGLTYLRRLP